MITAMMIPDVIRIAYHMMSRPNIENATGFGTGIVSSPFRIIIQKKMRQRHTFQVIEMTSSLP